jgi:hypothetical protein
MTAEQLAVLLALIIVAVIWAAKELENNQDDEDQLNFY